MFGKNFSENVDFFRVVALISALTCLVHSRSMSDSEDSDFSDNQSERSSDGEAEEAEENEVS